MLSEYGQSRVYLPIQNHDAIEMFFVHRHRQSVTIPWSLLPAQQSHISCHSSEISLITRGSMLVAGSFIGVMVLSNIGFRMENCAKCHGVPCSLPSRITTKVLKKLEDFFFKTETKTKCSRPRPRLHDQDFHFCP